MPPANLPPAKVRLARDAIASIDKSLIALYVRMIRFLAIEPRFRPKLRGRSPPPFGTPEYFTKTAQMFSAGRAVVRPRVSAKTIDPLLLTLFRSLSGLSAAQGQQAAEHHALFMVTENIVGKILEHYLALKLEPLGWIWCSGNTVENVDFVWRRPDSTYELLQVKNRDNTENAASAKGRGGIPKWARLKGKKARANWKHFPDPKGRLILSEADFVAHGMKIQRGW